MLDRRFWRKIRVDFAQELRGVMGTHPVKLSITHKYLTLLNESGR